MNYKIQLLDQSKLQETIDVCVGCFGEEWREMADDNFLSSLNSYKHKPHTFIALNKDENIVGMVMLTTVFLTPDTYSICWLGVDERFRRQGIASSLVKRCEGYILNDLMLFDKAMVMLSSDINKEYYEGLGYNKKFMTHYDKPLMAKYLNK